MPTTCSVLPEGTEDGPQAQQFFLQRKLGFVYLLSDPWCTQPLIRGLRRLERGVSTSMGNWATKDSRVAREQGARQKDNGRVGDSRLGWRGEKRC